MEYVVFIRYRDGGTALGQVPDAQDSNHAIEEVLDKITRRDLKRVTEIRCTAVRSIPLFNVYTFLPT